MPARDVSLDPIWRGEELGQPIPASPHAVSVALPRWEDVVGYEEKKPEVVNALDGALICNPNSPFYPELKPIVSAQHEELLWGEDAVVLEAQARGFPERMKRHNQNGLRLAERPRRHPAVERIWYPKWEFSEAYEAVRRPGGGSSGPWLTPEPLPPC